MKQYDVIVIGAGEGLGAAFRAESAGLKVALVDKGRLGGTCLNVGCIPSKILIHCADVITAIQEAGKLGIHANIERIDFDAIMQRMRENVSRGRGFIKDSVSESGSLDFYNSEARFVSDYTLETAGEKIRGDRIFIASGSRPSVPSVRGLERLSYLTNETVLDLNRRPDSLIIIGGGYIAVEYGHFFAAMGTTVTIIQRNSRLLPNEEPEVSELLVAELGRRMQIITNVEILEAAGTERDVMVIVKQRDGSDEREISAESMMVAVGRVSNADLLMPGNTGVEINESGYIKVDDTLQTTKEKIWAYGDAIGRQMFTHAGDKEMEIAWHNANNDGKLRMDFGAVPHAVYTHPQIASIGMTEEQARRDHDVLVGRARYSDVAKGKAMLEENSFAKAIVDKKSRLILGFHIIGPEASILIQEVVNAVANRMPVESITNSMHIFPALPEIVTETFNNLE
ncbi:MAG TPA: dihydrolipoyl dehydrogenase [Dissulfurispiraceae bacterium]|nr:dihydrolipoyl dehydrogenase [Dissulfurispiraceae bacterium]